jgi:hypothetical protein
MEMGKWVFRASHTEFLTTQRNMTWNKRLHPGVIQNVTWTGLISEFLAQKIGALWSERRICRKEPYVQTSHS